MRATGKFEVKMHPEPPYETAEGVQLGRISLDKTFSGELEATSRVEMLSAMSPVKGSAGYVAIERITGKLHGRTGSFVVQHSGTMNRGAQRLTISVVPDSGSGELDGIAGSIAIEITGGQHYYTFDYMLNGAK